MMASAHCIFQTALTRRENDQRRISKIRIIASKIGPHRREKRLVTAKEAAGQRGKGYFQASQPAKKRNGARAVGKAAGMAGTARIVGRFAGVDAALSRVFWFRSLFRGQSGLGSALEVYDSREASSTTADYTTARSNIEPKQTITRL